VKPPFYLSIEGVIGVGKTSLARLLQPRLKADLLLEVFEENPFLSDFYADRQRYAFQTQIFFLLSRYHQQQGIRPRERPVIADYTFAKDRLFARLNLHGDELAMYERVHRALAEKIRLPDLVVYLRANLDVLLARIAMRDRPYEREMDPDYIESLRQAYDQHFTGYTATPHLVIDTDGLDFMRNPGDLAYVEGRIRTALSAADVRARMSEPAASAAGIEPRSWPLVEEFLALAEAVGSLGAALAADHAGLSPTFREAMSVAQDRLQRIEQGAQGRK
jgi:deoxyguanosine kinase